jgi:hypothetical protein
MLLFAWGGYQQSYTSQCLPNHGHLLQPLDIHGLQATSPTVLQQLLHTTSFQQTCAYPPPLGAPFPNMSGVVAFTNHEDHNHALLHFH